MDLQGVLQTVRITSLIIRSSCMGILCATDVNVFAQLDLTIDFRGLRLSLLF